MFVWHDTVAQEVDEQKFYRYRFGGGTTCSTALKLIANQFENRFPPAKWNIFVFYFTDGENYGTDNEVFIKTLKESFGEHTCNMVAITQIQAFDYAGSVMEAVDEAIVNNVLGDNVKTTEVSVSQSDQEARSKAILDGIREILGAKGGLKKE
jgi:uncharacterized sporulation protein YeaH/YhbH (DUF444 family)